MKVIATAAALLSTLLILNQQPIATAKLISQKTIDIIGGKVRDIQSTNTNVFVGFDTHVDILSADSLQKKVTLDLPREMTGLKMGKNAKGDRLVLASTSGIRIYSIKATSDKGGELATSLVCANDKLGMQADPSAVTVSADGSRIYVTQSSKPAIIRVLDGKNCDLIKRAELSTGNAEDVAVVGDQVVVADGSKASVQILDGKSLERVKEMKFDDYTAKLIVDNAEDSKKAAVWVGFGTGSSVKRVSLAESSKASDAETFKAGERPTELALNSKTGNLYVLPLGSMPKLVKIDTKKKDEREEVELVGLKGKKVMTLDDKCALVWGSTMTRTGEVLRKYCNE